MTQTIRIRLSAFRWRFQSKIRRAGRACRYLLGRWTENDAYTMRGECEDLTGFYLLEGISRSSVLDSAIERYGDVPGLEGFVDDACSRVAYKWDGSGDTQSAAEDWAFDLISQYAEANGVTLIDGWSINAEQETEGAI